MTYRASIVSYLAVMCIAMRQRARERLALASRVAFFALLLFVFSRLWRILLRDDHAGPGPVESVWYLAVTEWITIPQPRIHVDIEQDVRSGDLAYQLHRPVSYLGCRIASGLGELLLSMAVLAVPGVALAYFFAGGFPADARGLWLVAPLGLLAATFLLLCHVGIGLTSFWLHDCSPIYWVWQKANFVLGGLMVPLVLYPAWLRELASWTPFAAMLSGPGGMVFSGSSWRCLEVGGALLLWILVALAMLRMLYLRGLRALVLNGG